ncbi:hypothetical protein J6590_000898 [Homalodisca vitripennis]|nr:hypothetical protein J6590_000898 [Homalodisca vitripennis]
MSSRKKGMLYLFQPPRIKLGRGQYSLPCVYANCSGRTVSYPKLGGVSGQLPTHSSRLGVHPQTPPTTFIFFIAHLLIIDLTPLNTFQQTYYSHQIVFALAALTQANPLYQVDTSAVLSYAAPFVAADSALKTFAPAPYVDFFNRAYYAPAAPAYTSAVATAYAPAAAAAYAPAAIAAYAPASVPAYAPAAVPAYHALAPAAVPAYAPAYSPAYAPAYTPAVAPALAI